MTRRRSIHLGSRSSNLAVDAATKSISRSLQTFSYDLALLSPCLMAARRSLFGAEGDAVRLIAFVQYLLLLKWLSVAMAFAPNISEDHACDEQGTHDAEVEWQDDGGGVDESSGVEA